MKDRNFSSNIRSKQLQLTSIMINFFCKNMLWISWRVSKARCISKEFKNPARARSECRNTRTSIETEFAEEASSAHYSTQNMLNWKTPKRKRLKMICQNYKNVFNFPTHGQKNILTLERENNYNQINQECLATKKYYQSNFWLETKEELSHSSLSTLN